MRINTTKTAVIATATIVFALLSPAVSSAANAPASKPSPTPTVTRTPTPTPSPTRTPTPTPSPTRTPAIYPPIFKEVEFNNSTIIIGEPKVTVTNIVTLTNASSSTSIAVNAPLRVIITDVKSGAVVKATLRTPASKDIQLPGFAANKSRVVTINALAIKIAGVYTLTFKLPNDSKKVLTITVS